MTVCLLCACVFFFVSPRCGSVLVSLWRVAAPDRLIKGPVRESLLCFSVIKQRIRLGAKPACCSVSEGFPLLCVHACSLC